MSRYIDADKLLGLYDIDLTINMKTGKSWSVPLEVVKQTIKDMPTADVVPLKDYQSMEQTCKKLQDRLADVLENVRGEWQDYEDHEFIYHVCSICGYESIDQTEYCPKCGAEMLGGES